MFYLSRLLLWMTLMTVVTVMVSSMPTYHQHQDSIPDRPARWIQTWHMLDTRRCLLCTVHTSVKENNKGETLIHQSNLGQSFGHRIKTICCQMFKFFVFSKNQLEKLEAAKAA